MAHGNEYTKKPARRFQFIDNNDLSSGGQHSTQVRRHVMQEHMRAKRHEARIKAEASAYSMDTPSPMPVYQQPLPPLPVRNVAFQSSSSAWQEMPHQPLYHHHEFRTIPQPTSAPWTAVKIVGQDKHFAEDLTSASQSLMLSKRPFHLTAASFAVLADYLPVDVVSPSFTNSSRPSFTSSRSTSALPSPSSIISAARTDPFDVLPVTRMGGMDDFEVRELFDFYAFVMPSCTYGFDRRHHKAHNWYRDIFIPEAMKGPVTFKKTVLVHAANTQDWKAGVTDSPLALKYREQAISALTAHYQTNPADVSDEVITATMSAAALEDFDPRLSQKPNAWLHWNAALNKIRLAGGQNELEYKPSLRKLVNWQDYILSGYDGLGSSFLFTKDAVDHDMDIAAKQKYGEMEIKSQCEDFLTFLNCSEHLSIAHSRSLSHLKGTASQPWRLRVFESTHPLFTLLASSNQERYTKTGEIKQIISRLAALLTINVALWEYRYDPGKSELFFQELDQSIRNNELDKNISVEALIQVLLSGSEHAELKSKERPWLVGRLLKVAKRLSRHSWERLNDFLLLCLTLNGSQGSIMTTWGPQLKDEILGAPLVCYRLPIMQA